MKVSTKAYEKRPVDLEWWAKFMDIMKCSPRSRDENGHYKTINVDISTDFHDMLMRHKGNFPDGWFKSKSEYMRMIIRLGIHSLDEWIQWEKQAGAFTFPEHDDLEQSMSIHRKLNKLDAKVRLMELGRLAGKLSKKLERRTVAELSSFLKDAIPEEVRKDEDFKKGEKSGRAGQNIKK